MATLQRAVLTAGVFLSIALASGCSRRASPAECTEMLDKYIEMTIAREGDLAPLAESERAAALQMKRAARKSDPHYAMRQAQCASEISQREYTCAMKAETPERWESCID